jgi:hypothetical protein
MLIAGGSPLYRFTRPVLWHTDAVGAVHPIYRVLNEELYFDYVIRFRGCMLYDLIPMMPEGRLRPLMERFSRMLHEQPLFADVFGPV